MGFFLQLGVPKSTQSRNYEAEERQAVSRNGRDATGMPKHIVDYGQDDFSQLEENKLPWENFRRKAEGGEVIHSLAHRKGSLVDYDSMESDKHESRNAETSRNRTTFPIERASENLSSGFSQRLPPGEGQRIPPGSNLHMPHAASQRIPTGVPPPVIRAPLGARLL